MKSTEKTNTQYLRDRLLARAGLLEPEPPKFKGMTYEQLRASQWSPEFEEQMRNRLMMGAFRYGLLGAPDKPQFDHVPSIERRLQKYKETGNAEHLVDIANLCMCETLEPAHPNFHFDAQDVGEDGEHCQVVE